MNGGTFRASTGITATGVKAPQGNGLDEFLSDAKVTASGSAQQSVSYGTGEGRFDLMVSQTRGLGPGASETFDLYTGTDVLTVFGETANFRVIRTVGIYVVSGGDTSGVAIGGASSNVWTGFFSDSTDKVKVFPSGPALVMGAPGGVAVTSTTCNLKVANLGAVSVSYRLIIVGAAAYVGTPIGLLLSLTYP